MMRRLPSVTVVAFAVALTAMPVVAQTGQKFSVQLSGLQTRFANDYDVEFGTGGEVQIRFNPSFFSIGIGLQRTSLTFDDQGLDVNVRFDGVFIEPRYVINLGSDKVAPYVSARLMALSQFVALGTEPSERFVDGTAITGGGGVLVVLGSRVNLDLGATAGRQEWDLRGAVGTETALSVVTRLGLAIGLF